MITDINSEDRLVQHTFADHLHDVLGWDTAYAWNQETFGPVGLLGRASERDVVLGARPAGGTTAPEPHAARSGGDGGHRKADPL